MNTPVSFELAKLLKKKGFDKQCTGCYDETGIYGLTVMSIKQFYTNSKEDTWNFAAPTIAEVVMWLYEKHGVWIWVERYSTLFRPYAEEIGDEMFGKWEGHKFNSPTEAYEAAILYTLNSLI